MSDDLLDTVSKALALDTGCLCGLPQCAECRAWSPLVENRNILRALLATAEADKAQAVEQAFREGCFALMRAVDRYGQQTQDVNAAWETSDAKERLT